MGLVWDLHRIGWDWHGIGWDWHGITRDWHGIGVGLSQFWRSSTETVVLIGRPRP